MNKLTIPPSPNYFEANILTCAVDNTVLYGSNGDLVVIYPDYKDEAAKIAIISNAHDRIVAVSTNNDWNNESKFLVSVGEDKNVRLWDINAFELVNSHNLHKKSVSKLVAIGFATDDRVVSVSADGFIVLWRPSLNETITFNNLITNKSAVTCLSICPHATWLAAFGQIKGIVVLADLRKSGKVLHNLICYDNTAINSLSWCPAPINIFPENKRLILVPKNKLDKKLATPKIDVEAVINNTSEVDKVINELDDLSIKNEDRSPTNAFESKNVKENPWINLKHADDDEIAEISDPGAAKKNVWDFDFLSECTALKYRILGEQEIDENEPEEGVKHDSCDDLVEDVVNSTLKDEHLESVLINEQTAAIKIRKEFLLASSSKSGAICIWRAGTDGRMQLELHSTTNKFKDNRRFAKNIKDKTYTPIFWIKPDVLLSSSAKGELLMWDLLKYEGNGKTHKSSVVHSDHRSLVFTISAARRILNNSSSNGAELTVWTYGQDRHIFETTLGPERKCLSSFLTLAFVLCLNASTIDSNRVAMGLSDGSVVLWNLSMPHTRVIAMKRFYHKNAKVTTLAWHPAIEHLLAYATSDGTVAILNTNISSLHGANHTFLNSFFKSPVHKVEWGPTMGSNDKYALYACGEGKLVYFDTDNGKTAPVPIEFDDEYITNMSWKPDYTVFALATKSPNIIIVSPTLDIICSILVPQKTIIKMLWHPTATLNSSLDVSKCYNWLAIGTRAGQCAVYNMTCQNHSDEVSSLVNELKSHSKQITSLSWSPYDDGRLITSSEDCTAQIWNVETGSIISSYVSNNLDVITNVLWSPLKEGLIISTARDILAIWNYSDYPAKTAQELNESLKSLLNIKQKYLTRIPDRAKQTGEEKSIEVIKKKVLLPDLAKAQNDATQALADCRQLLEASSADNNTVMQLFGTKEETLQMLTKQQQAHFKHGKSEHAQHLSLWKGDLIDTIKSAIANGTVTPWLIAISPMISPQLWQEACRSYAKKQSEESDDSDPTITASFFLACHDIESAVNVLSEGNMFREAVAVIKSRLVCDSEIYNALIKDVVEKWATHSIIIGVYEIAAQCYIFLGKYDEAAKALFKRSDVKSLQLAMDLANKSDDNDLKLVIKTRLDMFVKIEVPEDAKFVKMDEESAIKDEYNVEEVKELVELNVKDVKHFLEEEFVAEVCEDEEVNSTINEVQDV